MKTVINYLKAQSGTSPTEVFGIDVAITSFLKAFFRYSRAAEFFFFAGSDESAEELKNLARSERIDFSRCALIPSANPAYAMQDVGLLFRPDPNLGDHIWRRLQIPGTGYAVSSIVHTLSGERIADVMLQYLTAPTQVGDAIICPSRAIRDAIKALWDIQAEYLQHRFRGHFTCPVDLPVIPLGIYTSRFQTLATPQHRAAQRAALRISDDEVVILYVGRLSYATKAHPIALLKAAELAAQQAVPKKVRLVMYGFFKPELMEPEFHQLATDICKNVQVDFVLNNDPRFPDGLWACGDIFSSLIDNIQESFGFTPIEAMACGLPAVVSDWDGYRDGVRDAVDGYLVPTISIAPGSNLDVATHYYNLRNYGDYLIRNNQTVAVDIDKAAEAFVTLINDKEKRIAMGEAGRKRAIENYDWKAIIPAYEDLWDEQMRKRKSAHLNHPAPANWPAAHPSYPDPSSMFAGFASTHILATDRLEILAKTHDIEIIARHRMNMFGMDMLLPEDIMSKIMGVLYVNQKRSIQEVQDALSITDTARYMRTIAWFLKMGLMRLHRV
ncbi:MAG: glycosyltransferase [Alphaproteobacteria bacterium]|nr:glycosyltransferase [Alphaproteobacteria bacterium]